MPIRTIDDIQTAAVPVLEKTPAKKALVFGSWARGAQTRGSDIDMMVICAGTGKRFFDRYDDFDGLYDVLGSAGLDLLIYTDAELDGMMDRPFIQTAIREGIVIYER